MTDPSYLRITAIRATDALIEALNEAGRHIADCAVDARVFGIPIQSDDQEDAPTGPITEYRGTDGVAAGLAALSECYFEPGQHPKATRRAPGILCVSADLSGLVTEINQRKKEAQAAIQAFGYNGWRQYRTQVPVWRGLSRLQATREWHWLDRGARRIGFGWVGQSHGFEQIRVADMRARLDRQDREATHPEIEHERERLSDFDDGEVMVLRRPVQPTPIANIAYHDKTRGPKKTAIPMLTQHEMPVIKPLTDYDWQKAASHDPRNDQRIDPQPLLPYLHLYRYMPSYRFHLAATPVTVGMSVNDNAIMLQHGREQVAHDLPATTASLLGAVAGAAVDAHGAVPVGLSLDVTGRTRLIGANRSNAYIEDQETGAVWRLAISDIRAAARSLYE
jgi:hypothetical protein